MARLRLSLLTSLLLGGAVPAAAQMAGPTGVTATPGNGQITVTFPGVYGALSYTVYYSTSSANVKASGRSVSQSTGCSQRPCNPVSLPINGLDNGVPYYAVATVTTGNPPNTNESQPSSVVTATPTRPTLLYTINLNSQNISAFRLDQGTGVLTPIPGQPFGNAPFPSSLAVARDTFAFTVSQVGNRLVAYGVGSDGRLNGLQGYPALNGEGSAWIATDPARHFAYITDAGSAQVSAYSVSNAGALDIIANYHSGDNPQSADVTPDGRFLYVANYGANTVAAFRRDQTTGALTAVSGAGGGIFATGNDPISVTIDAASRFVYVANNGANAQGSYDVSAYTINQQTGELTGPTSYAAGNSPQSVAAHPNGYLYVANYGSNDISAYQINRSNGALTAVTNSPFAAGSNPNSIAFSPNGTYLYVSNMGDNTIHAFTVGANGGLTRDSIYGSGQGVGTTPQQIVIHGSSGPAATTCIEFTPNPDRISFSAVTGATSYVAYISTSAEVSPQNYQQRIVGIPPAGMNVTGLTSSSTYAVVTSVNAYGEGPPSIGVLRRANPTSCG